jgi:hypothetical protein
VKNFSEKHPKTELVVFSLLCLWNTSGVIVCDGWISALCLIAAILTGLCALIQGVNILGKHLKHDKKRSEGERSQDN